MTPEQKADLDKPLSRSAVKSREQGGRKVSYIEGWHAIAEANRIFGFDGWSRETIELRCVSERERTIGQNKTPGFGVTYIAKVRVCVGDLIREGSGSGHGIDRDCGQAHESALKEAETDAMKRALMTFGNVFGLALYDKTQENVVDDDATDSRQNYIAACRDYIRKFSDPDPKNLLLWWNSDTEKKARRDFELSAQEVADLKDMVVARAVPKAVAA